MKCRNLAALVMSPVTLILLGCGGNGGGGASAPANAPTSVAFVKVATAGSLPVGTTIGGILARVVATPSTGLSIADTDITPAGAGSLLVPNIQTDVVLGLINAEGLQTGEFATLTYHVAAGNLPKAADFSIASGATVIDATQGTAIPGITVFVQSVTIQ